MAETVYSGSVEPDQARTCEGNKRNFLQLKAYIKIVICNISVVKCILKLRVYAV